MHTVILKHDDGKWIIQIDNEGCVHAYWCDWQGKQLEIMFENKLFFKSFIDACMLMIKHLFPEIIWSDELYETVEKLLE